jgi:hypothetical protein
LSYILDEIYTESRHKKFENTYGILIEGYALKRLGKWPAILIPFFGMLKNVVLMAMIIGFIDRPYFSIMGMSMIALYWSSVQLYFWPLEDYHN